MVTHVSLGYHVVDHHNIHKLVLRVVSCSQNLCHMALLQTDGLVEWFNQTLKSMLQKCATKEEKDWDKLLPYFLFAYREVPQASTGFSPFELLYGWPVQGPLDILSNV